MSGPIRGFRDLVAWQRAYSLCKLVYEACEQLPESEKFCLANQLRRGAVSVPSNIAEGYGRGGRADYVRFLKVARGALYEVDTQISLCIDFRYFKEDASTKLKDAIDECSRVLSGLIRSVETPSSTS